MLGEKLLYPGPRGFGSPGLLHGGMRMGMRLIHLCFVHLLLVDEGDDPVLRLIAPDVSLPVAAAGSGDPASRRQMPFSPLPADGHALSNLTLPTMTIQVNSTKGRTLAI
jgi:hypothetical protein